MNNEERNKMGKNKKNKKNDNQHEQVERDDKIEFSGTVTDVKPGTMFDVTIDSGVVVLCTLGGKLRMNKIRVLLGDVVKIEVSPYDMSKGRVTWRK